MSHVIARSSLAEAPFGVDSMVFYLSMPQVAETLLRTSWDYISYGGDRFRRGRSRFGVHYLWSIVKKVGEIMRD
jgi:hypothetical protein